MGWSDDRKKIQNLMDKVNKAAEGSSEFEEANRDLDSAIKAQPPGRRFNALYRR